MAGDDWLDEQSDDEDQDLWDEERSFEEWAIVCLLCIPVGILAALRFFFYALGVPARIDSPYLPTSPTLQLTAPKRYSWGVSGIPEKILQPQDGFLGSM